MTIERVITDYSGYSDSDFDTLVSNIILQCENNANFVFANKEWTNLDAAHTTFGGYLHQLPGGGPIVVAKKNEARIVDNKCVKILTTQVNLQADGDLAKLQSSGAPLVKRKSKQIMEKPTFFEGSYTGVEGEVLLNAGVPKNFKPRGYMFAQGSEKDLAVSIDNWKHVFSTSHKITLNGFVPGDIVYFAVAYVGSGKTEYIWSTIIKIRII